MSKPGHAFPRRHFIGRVLAFLAGASLPWHARQSKAASLDTEPYLGEIMLFAGAYAPRGYAFCSGQLLPINQNQALFAILGTQYGGNGQTTFALPDLRGRVAIHQGQGPGLSDYTVGERAGSESYTLIPGEMPAHTHVARASSANGLFPGPAGQFPARNVGQIPNYAASADSAMTPGAISITGGGQPHTNMQPYLALNYIIALQGVFPSRN